MTMNTGFPTWLELVITSKWNFFHRFCVARVCQHQLGFLVLWKYSSHWLFAVDRFISICVIIHAPVSSAGSCVYSSWFQSTRLTRGCLWCSSTMTAITSTSTLFVTATKVGCQDTHLLDATVKPSHFIAIKFCSFIRKFTFCCYVLYFHHF